MSQLVSTAGAIRRASRSMPWSLSHRRGDGAAHVQKPNTIGENRLLKRLGAEDLSRLQPNLKEISLHRVIEWVDFSPICESPAAFVVVAVGMWATRLALSIMSTAVPLVWTRFDRGGRLRC